MPKAPQPDSPSPRKTSSSRSKKSPFKQRSTRPRSSASSDEQKQQSDSRTSQRARAGKRRQGQHPLPEERNEAQEAFLAELARGGVVLYAAQVAGVARSTVYEWLDHDEAFRKRYDQAIEDSNDVLLRAAMDRATYGVIKPVVSGGHIVFEEEPFIKDGEVVLGKDGKPIMVPTRPLLIPQYSDSLMALLLKARRPEFKDKQQVELTGKDGDKLTVTLVQEMANQVEDEVAAYRKKRNLPAARSEEHLG